MARQMTREQFDEICREQIDEGLTDFELKMYYRFYIIGRKSVRA
jgi:hypothetical protein